MCTMVRMTNSASTEQTQIQNHNQQQQQQSPQQQQQTQSQRPQKQNSLQKSQNKNFNNNNVASTSSSTSSLNSLSSSSLEQNSSSGGIVMVVPQQQQQQQQPPPTQQQQQHQQTQAPPPPNQQPTQYTHMQHVAPPPQHVLHHQQQQQQQQQLSPTEAGSNPPLPASPPLLQQTPTPPQGAQLVPCAVHHPQQHQQQMAIVAAIQAHMAATGGGPLPPHMHHHHHGPHAPPPPPPTHGNPHGPPQQSQQPTPPMENGHGGLSPSGSTTSSVSSNNGTATGGGGGSNMGNGNVVANAGAPPPPPGPGPLYIQYHGEFYPAEYYIAPHPHEGICPQHPHHHQAMCAIPGEYGKICKKKLFRNFKVKRQHVVGMVDEWNYNSLQRIAIEYESSSDEEPVCKLMFLSTLGINQCFKTKTDVYNDYLNICSLKQVNSLSYFTFSRTFDDENYAIFKPRPTTVQMVSQNRPPPPPMPVPVQVPQGQLTTNGTSHFYTPIPGGFPPGAGGQGPGPYQVGPHGHMPPPPQAGTPQPQQQQSSSVGNSSQQQQQHSPASHSANHSPSPPSSAVSSPAHSPSPRRQEPQINGHNTNNNGSLRSQQQHNNNNNHHQRKQQQQTHQQQQHQPQQQRNGNGASSVASSEEGDDNLSLGVNGADGDEEEDYQASIVEQLSTIQKPEVTDITSRSAKIVWEAPQCISESALQLINMRELRYNVLLSDRAKECKYKSLYKGSSYDCIVQDLKPGQEYVVRLQVHYEHLHGTASEPTEFTTPACEPDRPAAPRMVMCTKNSLHLRWNNPLCNGSSIQHYLLEYDEGKTGARVVNEAACKFVEAVKTKGRQYIMTKLQPSTIYNFRLAAVNEVGPSAYSPVCTFSTQGNPPSAPKPPTLQAFNSSSLRLVWERRQSDGATCIYVLQMLDRGSGHGYLNMYNGQDCSYECCQLRRATLYYFRLRAENEAGASAWSNEVAYKTAPERPGRPGKPYAKGKIHGTHFRVRWEPPTDNGGAEIQRYYLEINAGGQKFDRIYTGVDCEASCDRLQPGTTYQLRASCEGPGGLSPYSEVSHITSEAVVPAAPPSPYYDNPPGPYAAVLRLDKPEYNGGAPILEFELQLRKCSEQETPRSVYRGKDAYCSATQLHVSWQEPANKGGAPIAEYRLESATASNVSNDSESSTPQPPPSSAFHTCYQGLQTSADIRNLMPFTYYYFRVNACNMAGVSKWSPLVNCQTPAAVPSAPQIKDLEFTSNDATLRWSSPECNGSEITNYTIEYAERTIMTSDNACEYTVTNLQPETSYKFRVQAINAIGSGPYSLYAKLTTLPSPPTPPKLECSGVGHNFIKLKWGDGKNLDFTKFYVEMFVQRAKEFQVVYSGTNCMCKVNKLQERTAYTFRICAGNDRAGVGEYSEEFVFSTSACLPNSIKAPRIAQNLPSAASSASTSSANANSGSSPSSSSSGGGVIPSGLLPETPSFLTGLGNLMLGVPLTLEWQHSKNSFSDRVEYMLQYAIGKDGEFKKIYRGSETKFTIENLEPGGLYQFRVCPIRVTNNGEDLLGAYTPPFRHQVPLIPSLDDIDGNLLGNAAAQMFAGLNAASGSANHAAGSCHGHSHHHTHHSHMGGHSHHHNPLHSHHNSRHSGHHNNNGGGSNDSNSTTNLHHRSVSASAGSSSSSSNSSSSKNQNSNANNTPSNNTLLIGSNAIGFIPIGSMASELAASFAGCDDPNHHHHHHHHGFPDVANQLNATASSTSGSSNSSNNPQSAASLLAASANQLFANNPILLQAATAAISHHQHVLGHHHGGGAHNQNAGALRRFVTKLSSVYSNRKRFSDQEKAVIFMVSFLFFTFLFATLVKMFMR
ncbi:Fibronectin type-III domain-containing protein 3a [Lucilia cuprina]|nr:Fibronectin type-III domain-containing protein 3a [Lucilia cuprina]